MTNQSSMTQATISPHLTVREVESAVKFYEAAFGFKTRMMMPGRNGKIMHAQVEFGNGTVMIGPESTARGMLAPITSGHISPISIYVQVADVDAHHQQALAAGAKELLAPTDQFFGARTCVVMDPEGHQWMLAQQKEEVKEDASLKQSLNKGRFRMVNS